MSAATADALGVKDGDPVTVSTSTGAISLPVAVTHMPDEVVWVPTNSLGSRVHVDLGATAGDPVMLAAGGVR